MSRIPMVSLERLMASRQGSVDPAKFAEETFELYSIPAFDSRQPEVLTGADIGSTKQIVRPRDVLLSKIVPHIRRAWIVGPESDYRQIASGEWIVFRGDEFAPEYLRHALLCDEFHTQFMQTVSGVGGSLLRARPAQVAKIQIPLPPLPEQRRIAAILDKGDALRTKRREALAQLDRLAQAIFVEMFGQYEKGKIRWATCPLGELATEMKIGLVRSAEDFGDDFSVPYVRMNAVGRHGEFFAHLVQKTEVSEDELVEYCLEPGDILFNTRNSKELVGKTAIIRDSGMGVYNNNLMRLRFDERVDAEYVAECLLTPHLQQELEFRKSGTTSVFAIYARDVNTLPIPLPPIALQREFGRRASALTATRKVMAAQHEEASRMFASLQHRAFRGEL